LAIILAIVAIGIIIDGAPQLSSHMAAAVKCADTVLIPVKPSSLDWNDSAFCFVIP
jgi:MinD superfamily P-loop ATPase